MTLPDELLAAPPERSLERQLRQHIAVEQYFEQSGRTFRKSRRRLWFNREVKPRILRALFTLAGIYSRGKRNALSPIVNRVTLTFPDLPAWLDGFEILQISDLHIDEMDGLAESLARIIEPLRPDLCVLNGDYRWEIVGPCDRVYPRLDKVVSRVQARYGCIGILGNHDASEIALHLEERGVRMLVNESVAIRHNGASLWVAGTDDPFDYRAADLTAALADIPRGGFTVLLTHTPQLYREAAQRGVRLYLCGHTHAGQIRLPGLGAVKKNAPVPRALVQGHWRHEAMQGYTSWGAGCSTLPVRFGCPPEVALLRLVRSA